MDELWNAVLEDPDDDARLLVLADALTAAGEVQGSFITHQVALSGLDDLDPRRTALIAVTERLQADLASRWLAPLLEGLGDASFRRQKVDGFRNARFERGLLAHIALLPEDLDVLPTLLARTPLASLELLFTEWVPPELALDLSPFDALKISPDGWFTAHSVGRALNFGAAQLTALDVTGCDIGADGARLIVGTPTDLAQHFDDFTTPVPPEALEHLVLAGTNLGDDGLQALFERPGPLAHLKTLDLTQCRLTDGSLLPTFFHLALDHLALSGNNELDISGLATWEGLLRLRHLGLPKSITPEVFAGLLFGSDRLRSLDLRGAKSLLARPEVVFAAAAHFTSLDLGTGGLKDPGFKALVAAPSCQSLDVLRVNGCSLSDASVTALVESDLAHLHTLDLSSNKLSDASLERLAGWEGIGNVVHLRLRNNRKLSPAGYAHLLDCDAFQPVSLDVGRVDDDLAERLRSRFRHVVH